MNFLNYPIEIWISVLVAVIVRLKSSVTLNWTGALSTTMVAVGAGMIMYKPITALIGLSPDWELLMSILIALTAENVMKGIIDFSDDKDTVKNIIKFVLNRDPTKLIPQDKDKKDP